MYKQKLNYDWELISELENMIQLESNSYVDKVAVYCGDTPNDDGFFLYDSGVVVEVPDNNRMWAKAFNPHSYVIALEDTIKDSCFLLDGDFDCDGFLVREALVYC